MLTWFDADLQQPVDVHRSTHCTSLPQHFTSCMQIPREMGWIEYPDTKLRLTLQRLKKLRRHLFGNAAAALSDRLSDVELVQLLVVSAGSFTDVTAPHRRGVDLQYIYDRCRAVSQSAWTFEGVLCLVLYRSSCKSFIPVSCAHMQQLLGVQAPSGMTWSLAKEKQAVMRLQVSFPRATDDYDIACWLSDNCYTKHRPPERCPADAASMLVPWQAGTFAQRACVPRQTALTKY
jgi:hypothetical protein